MNCPSRFFVGGCILTCALPVGHQGSHIEAGAEGCVRQGWPDPPPAPDPDDNPELSDAVVAVKRDLGADAVMARDLAQRLPEHLRGPFWDRALDRYCGDDGPDCVATPEGGGVVIPVDTRRCWDLPPQPGPEVRVVEDRRGWRWERQDWPIAVRWMLVNPPAGAGPYVVGWPALFEFAPLVDATGEGS